MVFNQKYEHHTAAPAGTMIRHHSRNTRIALHSEILKTIIQAIPAVNGKDISI
jgi:hypothetical protein